MNRAKQKLRDGGTVFVFNPNFPAPALVEHAGGLGFDVEFIDCEHGSAGFERAEELARAARASGMTSILRPWAMERGLVTRFLDCGVGGIQFPGIEDAAAAAAAVDMVRGARGDRFADTLVTLMIESTTAVKNLPAILAVEGVDAMVVGLSDLAASLGHPGANRHPEVRRAAERIVGIVRDGGRAVPGYNMHHWEEEKDLVAQGVRWITVHARTMLDRGARDLFALLGQNK